MTPPLVLLPGLLCDHALWEPQQHHLTSRAAIHIADFRHHDSLAAMAAAVLAIAPPRFAVAGLSMGGYVALELLRQAAERIQGLALLATSARPDTAEQRTRRQDLMTLAERGQFRGVTPQLLPRFIHPERLSDQPLVDMVTAMTARVGPEAFLRQQRAIMARPDSRPDLADIQCRSLILCGRQDLTTPLEHSMELADRIPRSRLKIIEHCGHLPSLERPRETNTALDQWLDSL